MTATNLDDPAANESFAYDSIGNMIESSKVGTYSYPLPGSPRPHAVTSAGGKAYSYNKNGSMTKANGQTIRYDGDNRPRKIGTVRFFYGPDGRRVKKKAGTVTTLYLGSVEIRGGVMTKYLPGGAKRVGATTHWLHKDHLGSIQAVTDATGAERLRKAYAPYGKRLAKSGSLAESKDYIGERLDEETGLLYLNARYYDPELGRFISADPSGSDRARRRPQPLCLCIEQPGGAQRSKRARCSQGHAL